MIKNEDTAGRTGSRSAYFRLIQRLGNLLTSNKKEVVDLLNESGIYASYGEDENSLITKFVNNLSNSPKLVLNTSIFLESFNEGSNFDGDNIKKNYYTMRVFLDGNETYSNQDGKGAAILEKIKGAVGEQAQSGNVPGASTAQGAASGGVVGAVAGAVSDLSKLGTTALQGSQKKKYGAQDLAQKREETRNALLMTAMQNKALKQESDKKKEEQAQKTKRTVIIISSIVGALMIGLITYAIIKRK
jgi:hypothetical protein